MAGGGRRSGAGGARVPRALAAGGGADTLHPHLAVPRGCSLPAGYRFWARSAKRMDLESPPQNPPESTFLQVVAKNSRRITLGEERDARKARRSEARLRLVLHSGGRRRDATQLPREGPGCTKKRGRPPAKGVKWKTHSAGKQLRSQAHPHPEPCNPAPAPARFSILCPALEAGPPAPGTGWGQKGEQRAVRRLAQTAHLEMSGSPSCAPGSERGSCALPSRVGAPPPPTLICRHHPRWCSK